jgi:hypothetical protein
LINLSAEALYRAVRGVGDDVGRRRGNTVSFHVTVLCPYSGVRLDTGTETGFSALVFSALAETGFSALMKLRFSALVSTHPRDEGVDRRERFFIGMSVGSSVGTNG